jgi:hypothetical protein
MINMDKESYYKIVVDTYMALEKQDKYKKLKEKHQYQNS